MDRRSHFLVKLMKLYVSNYCDCDVYFLVLRSVMLICEFGLIGLFASIVLSLQPDTVTGDIVFIIQQKEHPKFKRKGDDLFVEHSLSLTDALCGFQFVLNHLDSRQLLIKSNPGEVVKPG